MSTNVRSTERVRNGVDTEVLFATLDAVKAQPEIARFQFRATNRWVAGAHNRTTIKDFIGAGGALDTSREAPFVLDAGEPAVLVGTDTGPNPAEYLLHALAACVTTSLVYVAAARGVRLTEVESYLEGDIDLNGVPRHRPGEPPERVRADPDDVPGEGRRHAREAARGRGPWPRGAPPSSTASRAASRSTSTS